jgi:pimeloyl-ACP methyl ester carboxylesterase
MTQIHASGLGIGYAEAGTSNGPAAILLCDVNSSVDVAPLATNGYRVIVPHARGFGNRRFVSSDAMRHGQQTAAASDVMALMAALEIEKALVGGAGESARAAEVMAALWPQRLKCIAPVSGSVAVTLAASQRQLPPKEELEWWYRYYFRREPSRVMDAG